MTRCERNRARRAGTSSSLSTTSTAWPGSAAKRDLDPGAAADGRSGDEVGGEHLVRLAVLALDHAVAAQPR